MTIQFRFFIFLVSIVILIVSFSGCSVFDVEATKDVCQGKVQALQYQTKNKLIVLVCEPNHKLQPQNKQKSI